mmetsp:Transcript_3363/g.7100  ORF Transcript_3363/g.7100 Transcript_3363/m.7100 type:complete len:418 (+) Transcript_3363:46-1299(+)
MSDFQDIQAEPLPQIEKQSALNHDVGAIAFSQHLDLASNAYYYMNIESGETSWDPPEDGIFIPYEPAPPVQNEHVEGKDMKSLPPVQDEHVEGKDVRDLEPEPEPQPAPNAVSNPEPESEEPALTKKTDASVDAAPVSKPKPALVPVVSPTKPKPNMSRRRRSVLPKTHFEWKEKQDETGATYFYNIMTGAMQWEWPEGFPVPAVEDAWEERRDVTKNTSFYYNRVSNESKWTMPEDMKKKSVIIEGKKHVVGVVEEGLERYLSNEGDDDEEEEEEDSEEDEEQEDEEALMQKALEEQERLEKERLKKEEEERDIEVKEVKRKKSMIEVDRRLSVELEKEREKAKRQSEFLKEEDAHPSLLSPKSEGPRVSSHSVVSSLGFLAAVAYRGGYVPTPILIAGLVCICAHVMLWGSTTTN